MEWKLIAVFGTALVLLLVSSGASALENLNPITVALAADAPALTK